MKIRAIIFDVYKTLLKVAPAPAHSDALWQQLWKSRLGLDAPVHLAEFSRRCDDRIARQHTEFRSRGINWPEIYWPQIVCTVAPELKRLSTTDLDEFLAEQAQIWHTTSLDCGAVEVLGIAQHRGIKMGIASNAQPYTLRELERALSTAELSLDIFTPSLRFWSFEHGFSKPDPHVFSILSARLQAMGIRPCETLMVGDRVDNDIRPASEFGWQTWRIESTSKPANPTLELPASRPLAGTWEDLACQLDFD